MRYEDASHTGAFQGSQPIANDDLESLAAGSRSAATGNLITGEGTQSGSAGADVATGAHVTAIAGKSGEDTSFAGGKLSVSGEHGKLSVDAEGNYIYQANAGIENVRDRFTYTIADNNGATDTASLIVEIGKTPVAIKADAQQVVPGPDGVVTLPPGVELSDVRVVGRNLVIDLPDGSQLIIVDGAVFVPQLVLDGVEIPSSNLAALLIGQEPQPAAGELPPSSGGNFDVPVPPLDPGVPLGDLIPPTEYVYTPPEPQEVLDELDRDPEIFFQPDGQPASVSAVDTVDEDGLPTRNGNLPNEPAGSDEGADGNPSNNSDPDETTGGVIVYNSPDGVSSIVITGFGGDQLVITGPEQVGQTVTGQYGTLTITSVVDGQIGYSYTLADNTSGDATHDDFSVALTDDDGDTATATLTINVIDDVPTARNDTDASVGGVATGNVMTDAAPGDVGDSDTNAADTVGADNATLTAVSGAGGSDSTFSGGLLNVNGQFGSLAIDAQGNYTYTVNPNAGGGGVDVFTYTLTDGDGDTSTATLTITNPDLQPNLPDPAAVLLDDDALANGIPGGTGDDVDSSGTPGVLVGTGGDGDLDYVFGGPNTLPTGFTVNTVNASTVQILQGGTVVLTVTLNTETGAFTVVQNNPIDHAAGLDENNISFGIGVRVVDADGDFEPATITINVDDDTPEMNRADVSLPTLTVDETDLAANASADYSVIFAGAYGADGAGTTSYAVSVVNGTDSGLVDVATGQPVLLYNIGGVVTGSTAASLAAVNAGNTVFTVSVNSNTGVVTLDQVRAVSHPDASNPDDPVSPSATSIQLTATITDGDGDPDSLQVNIGSSLAFEDDGPSISPGAAEPTLVVDESNLTFNHTLSFVEAFAAAFGADGPAGSGSISYSLGINVGATGLVDTATGLAVVLSVEGGMVVGRAGPGGEIVFTVGANASGDVTLDQQRAVRHADPTNPDESISLATDDLITITGTATDRDGDTASVTIGIGRNLVLDDDGPDISAVLTGNQIRIDETDAVVAAGGEVDPAGGNLGTVTVAAATLFTVSDAHLSADTPTTLGYGLVLSGQGVASGLLLSTDNSPIFLYDIGGGVIAGSTSGTLAGVNAGNTAFTVSVNSATGEVTLTQFLAVEHFNTGSHDEDSSGLNPGALSVQITATDGDGDTDQAAVDLGSVIRFEDDGPAIDVSVDGEVPEPVLLTQDAETDGVPTAEDSASSAANFGGVFNLAFTTGSDGAPTPTLSYALGISAPGVDSGLDSAGASIFLYNIGGVVVGSTSATEAGVSAGNTVFDVTVSGTGVVTLTQYSQIDHPTAGDPTATGSPFADDVLSLADGLVSLTASSTITDNDGDTATDSATVNIGANLQFADDGPDINAVLTGTQIRIDETDGVAAVGGEVDPVGGNLGTVSVAAATLFTVSNVNLSADTPTTLGYALTLSSQGVNSGLQVSSNNAPIFLYNIGGVVTGSTSATLIGVNAGNTAFTVSINSGTGEVTLTQFLAIEHPNTASNDEDSSAFAVGALNVTVTATDFDGDTDQASVDLGSVIRFEDDGPSAQNDVDSVVGGVGPATGNVITGLEIAVPEDGNNQDGVADNVGSDTPGSITRIASNNNGNFDAVADGGGNLVVIGQYGTLTINANGDYSYLRTDLGAAGVSDVFTYTLTDADGDPITATLTIGIEDQFPEAGNVNVVVDDDDVVGAGGNAGGPDDDAPLNPSGNLPGSGGNGALTWDLLLTGAPGGFTYIDGPAGSVLVQQGGTTVLTITLNASTGAYTVTQNAPIQHPTLDDALGNDTENNVSFTINYTVTDADGDPANGTINISVDDDTPTVDVSLTATAEPTLTTQDSETDGVPTAQDTASASFAANFNVVSSDGADGPASPVTTYALGVSVSGVDSGLNSSGSDIRLYLIGGEVIGSTALAQGDVNAGNTVFKVTVDGSGNVTLTQFSQIDHPAAGDPTPTGPGFIDHVASLADTLVTLTATATITDTDGDVATDSQLLNIGANLVFQDDGPDISAVLSGTQIRIDETDNVVAAGGETDGPGGNLGTVTMSAVSLFTVSNVNVSADSPTTLSYALVLSSQGVASGLLLSSSNAPILLFNIAGVIEGRTGDAAGPLAFTISIDAGTGAVTMTQFLAVEHSTSGASHDEDSSGFTAGVLNVEVTATDFDGDTDKASVDLGSVIRFEDDGPDVAAVLTGTLLKLDESDGVGVPGEVDIAGGNLGTITVAAGSLFTVTQPHVSSDTPQTLGYALVLNSEGVASGLLLSSNNAPILLFNNAGVIEGRTGNSAGPLAFTISINATTGEVTMTQLLAVEHSNTASHDEDSSGIAAGALSVRVTATDSDGDTDQASVDLGSIIRFEDDGPRITAASNINIQNSGDVAHTGTFNFTVGSDSPNPSNNDITNVTMTLNINGNNIVPTTFVAGAEDANTAVYTFTFSYSTGSGTANNSGTLTFDKVNDTYTVDLANPIQPFVTINSTSQATVFNGYDTGETDATQTTNSQPDVVNVQLRVEDPAPGTQELWVRLTGIDEPGSGTGADNLSTTSGNLAFTPGELITGAASWVSASNTANGVAGDIQGQGQVLTIDLFTSNQVGDGSSAPNATANSIYFKLDNIGNQEDCIVILKLVDANDPTLTTTRAIYVANGDMIKGGGGVTAGPGIYSGVPLDNNDALIIIENNDYNFAGENWLIVGAQLSVTDEGITGQAVDLNGAINTASTLNADDISDDSNNLGFKIQDIGFVSVSTAAQPATMTFNVTVGDADGDTASQTITATVSAAIDSSTPIPLNPVVTQEALSTKGGSSSQLASDSGDQQVQRASANSNTLTLAAAIAATGLAETQAAAGPVSNSHELGQVTQDSGPHFSAARHIDGNDYASSALLTENQAVAGSAPVQSSSNSSGPAHAQQALDNSSANAEAKPSDVPAANEQGPAPDSAEASPVAAAVAMPSAEALLAAGLTGEAKQSGSVEQIVAEALGEGSAPAAVDAILDALAGASGNPGAIAELASPPAAAVPAWDMATHGDFGAGHDMLINGQHVAIQHHDAVQPAING